MDTHRQVPPSTHADRLSEGGRREALWQDKECNLLPHHPRVRGVYAPDLTRVYKRIGGPGITSTVKKPEVLFKNSFRHMPNLGVTDQEAAQLVAFFEWTSNIDNGDWPPQDAKKPSTQQQALQGAGLSAGAAVFKEHCMGCHALGGSGGSIGPALDDVGIRMDAQAIARWVADPQAVRPGATMPAQKQLSAQQLQQVGEFLANQKGGN